MDSGSLNDRKFKNVPYLGSKTKATFRVAFMSVLPNTYVANSLLLLVLKEG